MQKPVFIIRTVVVKDFSGVFQIITARFVSVSFSHNIMWKQVDLRVRTCLTLFQTRDGLNAVPTTQKEKEDCQKILTPLQLHHITIGDCIQCSQHTCLYNGFNFVQ